MNGTKLFKSHFILRQLFDCFNLYIGTCKSCSNLTGIIKLPVPLLISSDCCYYFQEFTIYSDVHCNKWTKNDQGICNCNWNWLTYTQQSLITIAYANKCLAVSLLWWLQLYLFTDIAGIVLMYHGIAMISCLFSIMQLKSQHCATLNYFDTFRRHLLHYLMMITKCFEF